MQIEERKKEGEKHTFKIERARTHAQKSQHKKLHTEMK